VALIKAKTSKSRLLARMVLVVSLLMIVSAGTYLFNRPETARCQNAVEAVRKIDRENIEIKESAQKEWNSYRQNKGKSEGMTRFYSGFNDYFNSNYARTETYRNSLNLKYLVIVGDKQCFSPLLVARARIYLKNN
jgi:uncharacterized ion transporter superfamily protein YfcC